MHLHKLHLLRHNDTLIRLTSILFDELRMTYVLGDSIHEGEQGFITISVIGIHYLRYLDPSNITSFMITLSFLSRYEYWS